MKRGNFLKSLLAVPAAVTISESEGLKIKDVLKGVREAQEKQITKFEDLPWGAPLENVFMSAGKPKTTAGRIEYANELLHVGIIKTPEEYIAVLDNGWTP